MKRNIKVYMHLDPDEVKKLKVGDKIAIGIKNGEEKEYVDATVVRPMFWNSDADEPDWEVETTNGFVDIYSIYQRYSVYLKQRMGRETAK